ncbi:MAG: HindVP family restriction endonuclease, partial [Clostridiales bacterium]|nr:HindVP family restriction endonuclease [Clostridiales bacterium]
DIPAIFNKLTLVDGKLKVVATEISMRDVFNSVAPSCEELDFRFETRYEPYQGYSFDMVDGIDLVIKSASGEFLSPLEIKLTVLPTAGTAQFPEEQWGCEMVVRSATTSYCALGMFDSVKDDRNIVREIFEEACADVGSWTNDFEMTHKTPTLAGCVNEFEKKYLDRQKPLLMQTIWKTQGQSPVLADNAFDIVVWSDYAFSRLFLDNNTLDKGKMSRPMRASAKLARCLWELSKSGKIRLAEIYRQMAFDTQTDKEFAISGQIWTKYISSERILNPILPKEVLNDIIEPGYIERLRPERRFDQTLYFTIRH